MSVSICLRNVCCLSSLTFKETLEAIAAYWKLAKSVRTHAHNAKSIENSSVFKGEKTNDSTDRSWTTTIRVCMSLFKVIVLGKEDTQTGEYNLLTCSPLITNEDRSTGIKKRRKRFFFFSFANLFINILAFKNNMISLRIFPHFDTLFQAICYCSQNMLHYPQLPRLLT